MSEVVILDTLNQNTTVKLTAIEGTKHIDCPHCGVHLLKISASNAEVVGGGTWLQDGDTIPGLYQALLSGNRLQFNHDYELLVGTCRHCEEHYFVVELKMANQNIGASENDFQDIICWFEDNVGYHKGEHFSGSYSGDRDDIPKTWLVEQSDTDKGLAHIHTFGPFKLEAPGKVIGRCGVAACQGDDEDTSSPWCFAKNILLILWDDLYGLTI